MRGLIIPRPAPIGPWPTALAAAFAGAAFAGAAFAPSTLAAYSGSREKRARMGR